MEKYEEKRVSQLFREVDNLNIHKSKMKDELESARMFGIIQGLYCVKNHWVNEWDLESNFNVAMVEAFNRLKKINPSIMDCEIDDIIEDKFGIEEN